MVEIKLQVYCLKQEIKSSYWYDWAPKLRKDLVDRNSPYIFDKVVPTSTQGKHEEVLRKLTMDNNVPSFVYSFIDSKRGALINTIA